MDKLLDITINLSTNPRTTALGYVQRHFPRVDILGRV